jgi:PDZ domain-containing protein
VRGITVAGFADESPAKDVLRVDDIIQTVNGIRPTSVQQLRDLIAEVGAGNVMSAEILRDDSPMDVLLTPYANDEGDVVLGIGAGVAFDFPFDVTIRLDDVGGPSAGMMFALGIIDKLTPGDITSGLNISGTGTIDPDGNVGPIGGIRQKLFGAQGIGSPFFLAPADNCDQVVGHIPDGLAVFAVSTLDEALNVLDFLSDHTDATSALAAAEENDIRTCDVVAVSASE